MLENEVVIKDILISIIKTVRRRVDENFAVSAIGAIIKTLETKYDYFKFISVDIDPIEGININVSSNVNYVNPTKFARAIEMIVQIVYFDLKEQAGLYFIREIVRNANSQVILSLNEAGVDLELLELQHQFLRKRENRKMKKKNIDLKEDNSEIIDNESLLGYSMNNVSHWEFDLNNNKCIIYGKDNNVLDRIDLNNIVKRFIVGNSKDQIDPDIVKNIELSEKEYQLLKILQSQDTDAYSVCSMLNITADDLNEIVKTLTSYDMVHYISSNELVLSEIGQYYIKKKEKKIEL